MNSVTQTDAIEQIKYLIGGLTWDGGEITEGEVFGSLGHRGHEEAEVDAAIGELLDAGEIVATMIKVTSGWLPGLRRAVPLTAEQKRVELDAAHRAHAAVRRASDAACVAHEKELRLMRSAVR